MNEVLNQILGSELLTDETKAAISEAFKKVLDEAKVEQEKALRADFAERYERDKVRIAEAVEQFVETRVAKEMGEMRDSLKSLETMKANYAEATVALKDKARSYVAEKISIFEQAARRAFKKEITELHSEVENNRKILLQKIAENDTRAAAERQAFRKKAAGVMENIVKVKMEKHFSELAEDIRVAKENDFGRRIFESVYAECRRMFFNSSAELKGLTQKITEQEKAYKANLAMAQKKLNAALAESEAAKKQAGKLQESAVRGAKIGKMLGSVPAGKPRDQMKLILEATQTANLDQTFNKYAKQVLAERTGTSQKDQRIQKVSAEIRTGNASNVLTESVHAEDDEDIIDLRRRIGK